MTTTGFKGPIQEARPRRTVRIVKKRIPTQAAALSLAAVALTAVFTFGAWRWWDSDTVSPPPAPQPTLFEVELDWRCAAGHTFSATGQVGTRICPQCGQRAYPFAKYSCEKHGAYEVQAEFVRDAAGKTRVGRFKVSGGEWAEAGDGPRCPRCGAVMERKLDPLAGMVRPKRKSGG